MENPGIDYFNRLDKEDENFVDISENFIDEKIILKEEVKDEIILLEDLKILELEGKEEKEKTVMGEYIKAKDALDLITDDDKIEFLNNLEDERKKNIKEQLIETIATIKSLSKFYKDGGKSSDLDEEIISNLESALNASIDINRDILISELEEVINEIENNENVKNDIKVEIEDVKNLVADMKHIKYIVTNETRRSLYVFFSNLSKKFKNTSRLERALISIIFIMTIVLPISTSIPIIVYETDKNKDNKNIKILKDCNKRLKRLI